MSSKENRNRRPWIGLATIFLSAFLLAAFAGPALAERGGPRGRDFHQFRDSRYQHNRVYPYRGQYVPALPRGYRAVPYGRSRYYFHSGIWYRPLGGRYVIVAPPVGLFVPFLPPFYTTIWVAGGPYYYANDVYYARHGDGYAVVAPPKDEPAQTAPSGDQMFVYPRQGQSEKQQADDRYACHRWAADQARFDPTQPGPDKTEAERAQGRTDYQRAVAACLDGRGYTVK